MYYQVNYCYAKCAPITTLYILFLSYYLDVVIIYGPCVLRCSYKLIVRC